MHADIVESTACVLLHQVLAHAVLLLLIIIVHFEVNAVFVLLNVFVFLSVGTALVLLVSVKH